MPHDQAEPHFKFQLLEHNGMPGIDDEEATAYVAFKTGLTVEQVRAVQAADFEYLNKCGLVVEE